jgi:hypothetical protein
MVETNKTITRFWNAQEGSDWIAKNEMHNDDYRAERDPMKLTKLERKREQNQTFEMSFPEHQNQPNQRE